MVVGDQSGEKHSGGFHGGREFEQFGRIPELGDPFGADETGDFDLVDACQAESLDESGLVSRWNESGLVLEAVAWGDIGDGNSMGHCTCTIAAQVDPVVRGRSNSRVRRERIGRPNPGAA